MPSPADATGYITIIEQLLSFGPIGIVLIMLFYSLMQNREVLKQYSEDMAEQRKMYENNFEFVKDYHVLAKDLKEIIILNTQTLTRLTERLKQPD